MREGKKLFWLQRAGNEDVLLMETLFYSNVGRSRVADSLLKHATI